MKIETKNYHIRKVQNSLQQCTNAKIVLLHMKSDKDTATYLVKTEWSVFKSFHMNFIDFINNLCKSNKYFDHAYLSYNENDNQHDFNSVAIVFNWQEK